MPNTEEQRLDIIENCEHLLTGILSEFNQTDNTPQGRMITQCKWLKERAENNDLSLPVKRGKLGSLLYIYTNGEMFNIDLAIKDRIVKNYDFNEVEIYMGKLIELANEGRLLTKPPYTPYALRSMDALIKLLQTAPRPLSQYEQGLIPDLEQLRQLLDEGKIEPPLGAYMPQYPNFRAKYSLDDIPNGKNYFYTVYDFIFNGVRPDSWLTPEDADRETRHL
ncbi:MAG: hypothetical protein L3K25_17440 [Gammaproteobacteria bacterium]|nr:hypothetical protein [Gammaproteobacteria bacterium]